MAVHLHSPDWSIRRDTRRAAAGRRSAGAAGQSLPPEFLTSESTVEEEFAAEPPAAVRRGAAAAGALDFSVDLDEGESAILAVRHPSGALSFHLPVESGRRGGGKAAKPAARFSVTLRPVEAETGRRGVISQAVKAVVVKVAKAAADKAVSLVLPKLIAAVEKASWNKRGLKEGWKRVTPDSLAGKALAPAVPSSAERSLLLIHGTFSNAAASFGPLAAGGFFDRVAPLYGERFFAFDHFSLSRTPEENARMLLEALPNQATTFDVITHSRGGLVLRNLVERSSVFGPLARRFKLGHAVLVASPNGGTPLATPERWQETVGWLANIIELFPDNPFTTGADFVGHAMVWLARHLSGDVPGLHAMDGRAELIAELQGPPDPPGDAYSALVSNYDSRQLLQRLVDAGIDQFFGSANDLVVPAEGGWRVDNAGSALIPASRIGCFGPGGNLSASGVSHVEYFSQPESVTFLETALSGRAHGLAAVDPARALPDRRVRRGAAASGAPVELPARAAAAMAEAAGASAAGAPVSVAALGGKLVRASDTFHLMILPRAEGGRQSQILAQYGSARVLEDFYLTGGDGGKRWQTIIAHHEGIKKYVDGQSATMPSENQLKRFGEVLFETLLPGSVRRLYDTARSLQRSERLNVIFTSTIPWVADKPWEFAYDPVRKTALATEERHFIRNVMTAVPAELIDDNDRLRILVASAQPVGLGQLSIDEETTVIRRGFEPLREAGLAEVTVLPRATPDSLHRYVSTGRYSVLHFIGHGEYDAKTDSGSLIFQSDDGKPYPIDDRSAREILCGRGLRLVFLNACETGQGGHADFNSGVAPALVAGGVPIVVANQYKVLDTSATLFAQHFYWSLAHGMALGEAAREARIAVTYSMSDESIDWAVPVVYARDPGSRLCPPRPVEPSGAVSPTVPQAGRRSTAGHERRVAVWDTSAQFPALRKTLDAMNGAQRLYGFEIVDLSVPLDAWYRKGKERFLDADRFASRLAPQLAQLGVRYLTAIVNEYLACDVGTDEEQRYIYGWWPAPDKPAVLIFSTKGLNLEADSPATTRAIANVAVTGLAGYLLDIESHEYPPQDCPNYYNPDRSVAIITGRQRFCARCVRLFRPRTSELAAMSAILDAFGGAEPAPARRRPRRKKPAKSPGRKTARARR